VNVVQETPISYKGAMVTERCGVNKPNGKQAVLVPRCCRAIQNKKAVQPHVDYGWTAPPWTKGGRNSFVIEIVPQHLAMLLIDEPLTISIYFNPVITI
jgi:hypothetical protein